MSGRRLQGAFYAYSPRSDGYIEGRELLNYLLPVWWGERAHLNLVTLFGHEAGWGTNLGTLEQEGQILIAIDKINADAHSRPIEFFVVSEDSDQLQSADRLLLNHGLRNEKIRSGRDEPAASAKGEVLILREQVAEDWLDQLQSPHVLPDPLKRDDDTLPEGETVSLCELVTWLADGKALQGEDDAARLKDRQAFLTKLLDRSSAAESSNRWRLDPIWEDCDRPSLARLVAEEIAREVRVGSVKIAIVKAMLDGEIRGYADGASGSGQKEPIPSQLPSITKFEGNRLSAQTAQGSTWTRWENVIFERDDLIRHWGDVAGGNNSGAAGILEAKPKGGRRVRNTAVLEAFDRLAPEGKTEGVTWRILAQRVSKEIGWEISADALAAAVRRRDRATKPT